MKKFVILFAMIFAYSFTQAATKISGNNQTGLQQNTSFRYTHESAAVGIMTNTATTIFHHADKTKHAKANRKPKVRKEKQHKSENVLKGLLQKKNKTSKTEHKKSKKATQHHHKK